MSVLGLIDQQSQLDALITAVGSSSTIGLDTEFVRISTFHPKPGLVQIAVDHDAFLIDPLADLDLKALGHALTGTTVSILHAAQEDYEVLFRLTGSIPSSVFDTQVAYAMLNDKISLSLSRLVVELLGKELSKEQTRSDWTRRPLSPAQYQYAKEDVLVLGPIYEILYRQLEQAGRLDWMSEEMRSIQERNATSLVDGDLDTQVQKFGNAWRLSPEGMSRLVHLVQWREDAARRIDKPRKHILGDQSLFSLAAADRVGRHHQLVSQHGLTNKQADRFGSQLKRVLADALEAEMIAPPPPPLSKRLKGVLKERQIKIEAIAKDLGIAPEMLVKKRQLIASLDARQWMPSGWRKPLLEDVFCG
ncbi:HRDC domain-containing protein [Litorivicinus sp.]|nr:HRDC domain-containing protein [Litorivicinus sp.]